MVVKTEINLITDRTKQDIENETSKGFYNYTDLNRVQNAARYVAERLAEVGAYTTLIDDVQWSTGMFPTETQLKNYLENIYKCVCQLGLKDGFFNLPTTMYGIDYNDANSIEKTLKTIDGYIDKIQEQQLYSGTIYAGERW